MARITRWHAVLALSAALAASILAAATALAAAPDREPYEPGVYLIQGACDFDVLMEDQKVGGTVTVWTRPDGSFVLIAAGQLQTRLTNTESGASILVNVSGPEHLRASEDAFSDFGTGRWLQWDPDNGGLFLTSGRIDYTGATVQDWIDSLRGSVVDLCRRLS